jgi:hypothetical protein
VKPAEADPLSAVDDADWSIAQPAEVARHRSSAGAAHREIDSSPS